MEAGLTATPPAGSAVIVTVALPPRLTLFTVAVTVTVTAPAGAVVGAT
jgi:hypothetical protein